MDISRFKEIIKNFSSKKMLVIGDLMLDSYIWGKAERISPEAPVPVIKVDRSNYTPGGAANVALNLNSLLSTSQIVGVVGSDPDGTILTDLLTKEGINSEGIVNDSGRHTTVKTRVIAHGQQVVRVDREFDESVDETVQQEIMKQVARFLPESDGVILSDYNKGVLTVRIIQNILDEAHKHKIPVYVDPKKENFFYYKGVRLFKPNFNEFISGVESNEGEKNIEELGVRFQKQIAAEILLITQGEKGMMLFSDNSHQVISTKARLVHDVSGAGDTVISTFALSDLSGADPIEAATIANYAAGRVCEEVGVVPINLDMLIDTIDSHNQVS